MAHKNHRYQTQFVGLLLPRVSATTSGDAVDAVCDSVQVCGKARMFLIHLPGSNFSRTGTPKGICQEYRNADFRAILGKYMIEIENRRSRSKLEFCISMCMYYNLSIQWPASECGNGCMNRYSSICTGKLANATRPDHESDVITYIRDMGCTSSDT